MLNLLGHWPCAGRCIQYTNGVVPGRKLKYLQDAVPKFEGPDRADVAHRSRGGSPSVSQPFTLV
eukprot:6509865-Pyramimonas_sp.AAC.1